MEYFKKTTFKNLKPHIAEAIKESCYYSDVRLYNIANEVHNIETFSFADEGELALDLSKIIDKTIKDSVGLGCDLSIIAKGIFLGAFRASPFIHQEAPMTIRLLINEILKPVFKYKGDAAETIKGVLSAIIIVAKEFNFNAQEALNGAREDILSTAKTLSPAFADDIKKALSNSDDSS